LKSWTLFVALLLSACVTQQRVAGPASGSAVWLKADAGVTADDGRASSWADQSGHGNNATMAARARQPRLITGEVNGEAVIRFDGAQSLALTTPVSPRTFTVFVVGRNRMSGEDFSMILGPGGSTPNNQLRWEDGCHVLYVGTGNDMPPVSVSIGDTRITHILALRYQGSNMEVYRDGRRVSAASLSTSGPWILSQIGAWYSKHYLVGDIAELLIYPSSLPDAALGETTAYLRAKHLEEGGRAAAQIPPAVVPGC
jgi:hypothetical protein